MIKKGEILGFNEYGYKEREFVKIFCNAFCHKHEANCRWCILNEMDFWQKPMTAFIRKGMQ